MSQMVGDRFIFVLKLSTYGLVTKFTQVCKGKNNPTVYFIKLITKFGLSQLSTSCDEHTPQNIFKFFSFLLSGALFGNLTLLT